MNPISKNSSKGFTLIEVVIALALVGIIVTMAFSFLVFGNHAFGITNRQYEVQSDVRRAIDYINKQARFATDIDLLDAAPSPADADEYDYIYIDGGGNITHSSYNGGSAREEKTVVVDLVTAESYFTSEKDGKSLGVILKSIREGHPGDIQDYDITSEIELPNIALNKRVFADGHSAAKAVKFKVDTTLAAGTPGGPALPPAPPPAPAPVYVNVKIVVKTPANADRYFKVILDGVEKIPVKTANKTYTADFGSFLTGSSLIVSSLEADSEGGTYNTFYDSTLEVSEVDLVYEIPAP